MNRAARLSMAAILVAMIPACGKEIEWFPERQPATTQTSQTPSSNTPASQMGGALQRLLTLTATVSTFAGSSAGALDGTGTAAEFNGPVAVTTDGTSLFVADSGNFTIRRIDLSTGFVSTLAGSAGKSGTNDGTGGDARFLSPASITTDGTSIYAGDGSAIRKIVIATGVVTTLAGSAGSAGYLDGTGTAARFATPYLTTNGTYLFIADSGNETVRRLDLATGAVTTIAGMFGSAVGTDGLGTAARFSASMKGITTDGTNIFVSDTGNHTIRAISPAGFVSTLAGTPGNSGWADGTTWAARFWEPAGITTDGTNVYASDSLNSTIRRIVISTGTVTTLAGTHGVVGATDAVGTAASFNHPQGITTDGTALFVADRDNHRIRKIK